MYADVPAFVAVDVNGRFRLGLALGGLNLGLHDVVLGAYRNALRELAVASDISSHFAFLADAGRILMGIPATG